MAHVTETFLQIPAVRHITEASPGEVRHLADAPLQSASPIAAIFVPFAR